MAGAPSRTLRHHRARYSAPGRRRSPQRRARIVEEDAPAEPEDGGGGGGDEPIPAVEQAVDPVSEDDLFAQIKEAFDAHEVKESR